MNLVPVSASLPSPGEVSPRWEIRDNVLNRPFSDPHPFRYAAGANRMVLLNADEHMGMVGQERPRPRYFTRSIGNPPTGPNRVSRFSGNV